MDDIFGLRDKVVTVIGGGLGIGEASCRAFAAVGAKVGVVDIDGERAARVASAISENGGQAHPITADVLAPDAPDKCVGAVLNHFGRADVLVTVVGQAQFGPFVDLTRETWDAQHAFNLKYFAFFAQAFAKAMIAGGHGGAISAVASVSGTQSAPNHAAYGAAKAGLINLVRSLAVELAPKNVRINCVSRGSIATPRNNRPEMGVIVANSLIPFKRRGTCEEIANGLLYLSSDLATYVTGHNLCVDGGFMAQWLLGDLHTTS